jgi:hypothetical protein
VRVGARTTYALLVSEVSRVIPEVVGAIEKVLLPVPEEATNADERVVSPSVVTIETVPPEEAGWLEFPVGEFTFVVRRAYELESVIFASELTDVRAIKVFASTVTKADGVKFAVVVEVPE